MKSPKNQTREVGKAYWTTVRVSGVKTRVRATIVETFKLWVGFDCVLEDDRGVRCLGRLSSLEDAA